MSKPQSQRCSGNNPDKKEKQRGWGGRLKPAELRNELSSGNPSRSSKIISAEEEASLREALALLHQEYYQRKELAPINLHEVSIRDIEHLRSAFNDYEVARSKSGRRVFAATTGPLAVLLGIRPKEATTSK